MLTLSAVEAPTIKDYLEQPNDLCVRIRLNAKLAAAIEECAKAEDRTQVSIIRLALASYIVNHPGQKKLSNFRPGFQHPKNSTTCSQSKAYQAKTKLHY